MATTYIPRIGHSTPLATRILWGLAAGVLAAVATLGIRPALVLKRKLSVAVSDPLGQISLRRLFLVLLPLVFASLASGVAQFGQLEDLGLLAGRSFTPLFANMLIAVALFVIGFALALARQLFGTRSLWLRLLARRSPLHFSARSGLFW